MLFLALTEMKSEIFFSTLNGHNFLSVCSKKIPFQYQLAQLSEQLLTKVQISWANHCGFLAALLPTLPRDSEQWIGISQMSPKNIGGHWKCLD